MTHKQYVELDNQPISFKEACRFILDHHSHLRPPQGHKFSIAANDGEKVVGVVIVGRPTARHLDNGWTLEVTRCCVADNVPNAASFLYAKARQAAKALGFKRLITYTLATESGTCLIADQWKELWKAGGGTWNRKNRPRVDTHPLEQKMLWEAVL